MAKKFNAKLPFGKIDKGVRKSLRKFERSCAAAIAKKYHIPLKQAREIVFSAITQ